MVNTVYYESEVGIVRNSIKSDCFEISKYMRKQDVMEAWSALKYSPIEMILLSFKRSTISMTIERKGFPVAMFGIMADNLAGETAVLWMLSTDGINGIGRIFVRHSKEFIKDMFKFYPVLYGYVDLRNTVSIKFLTFLGADWGDTVPYGLENKPFRYFKFKRS